jgi:hypothetical protein
MHWNPLDKRRKISTAQNIRFASGVELPPTVNIENSTLDCTQKMTPLITIVKPHKIIIIWNKCIFPPSHCQEGEIGNRVTFYMLDQSKEWKVLCKSSKLSSQSMNFLCSEREKIANFLFAKGNAILNGKLCRHERAFKTKRLWKKIIVFDASVEVNRYLLRSRSWLWMFGGRECGDEQGGR